MAYRILVLGASYGSLLATKCAMAGHDTTLVCRSATAKLINAEGTVVRISLKGESELRAIRSLDLPGRIDACPPEAVDVAGYDLVVLAMQEPQYAAPGLRALLSRVAQSGLPCLSLMNMPPLAYLNRLPGLDPSALEGAYTDARVWDGFDPGAISLCSPDPQAFRPPQEAPNVLQVGLATNFKAAPFADPAHTAILRDLEADIDAVSLDGRDVPVKLRLHQSIYVPLSKWAMLMAGNYRCVRPAGTRSISDAVLGDVERSRATYDYVNALLLYLGADPSDFVPFEKYAKAAESLVKPSSVARAIASGATAVERVDRLVQAVGYAAGMANVEVDRTVALVDRALEANRIVAVRVEAA